MKTWGALVITIKQLIINNLRRGIQYHRAFPIMDFDYEDDVDVVVLLATNANGSTAAAVDAGAAAAVEKKGL